MSQLNCYPCTLIGREEKPRGNSI
uniref:Uncharacterized protein n=1 Tax=Rhizophora mucronata TaxID=61149 RepID=A0A2P2LT24_RHIMU